MNDVSFLINCKNDTHVQQKAHRDNFQCLQGSIELALFHRNNTYHFYIKCHKWPLRAPAEGVVDHWVGTKEDLGVRGAVSPLASGSRERSPQKLSDFYKLSLLESIKN